VDYSVLPAIVVEEQRVDTSWGVMRWLANREIGNVDNITVGRVMIKKGSSNPRHSHSDCEEVLYLFQGRLQHCVGDEEVILDYAPC
jgi:quercetin dioxygenase-like cupin family protein